MTARVVRASDVAGLPVVSISSGEDIAEIKDVVFDGTSHSLVGFTLNKRGWFRGSLPSQLPAGAIAAIGPDAVMVASDDSLQKSVAAPAELSGDAKTHAVIGNLVVSADGAALGKIIGVILATQGDPTAVGYEVESADGTAVLVPITAQMALSDNNLLVPTEANDFITNDLAGFGASIEKFRAPLKGASE